MPPLVWLLRLLAVPLALTVVAANVYYDYISAPSGILWSPVAALLACGLVLFGAPTRNPYLKAGLCAGLLMGQDAGIKLFGGGVHDAAGQGLMNFAFVAGALLSLLLLAAALRQDELKGDKEKGPVPKGRVIGLFLAVLLGHLLLFGWLGFGRYVGTYME
ncbi:hypothetical protein [Hymenobacter arizonensis]|uniref:hypothetical protein n=1 Tax=Hymenobacter arizonensis TaxID=1227077 RepID=UPI001160A377|nr:hypothetical protein [Hymenobacter arizonensis]